MIKYGANAFLATKISFINEMAMLCEKTGADIKAVAKGMGLDGRIGNKFLHAGPGYGGSCFPKDTQALARIGQEHASPMRITETVIAVNEDMKRRIIGKVMDLCGGSVNGKTILVLGVTFKPNTDDMREAPSLTIVPALVGGGAQVRVVDPHGQHEGKALLPGVTWEDDPYAAATGADAIVLLTEWNEFRGLDLKRLADVMDTPRMADLRNVYPPEDLLGAGFVAQVGDLLGEGFSDDNRRKAKPIVPITGPMERILRRLVAAHGDGYLIHDTGGPVSTGARNWTQIIQRLVARAKKDRTPDQVRRKLFEPTDQGNVNWYSIRRTYADWLDERVSDAAISAVMGHFEISSRTRRQLFESGSPTTELYKRRKLGPVLEVATVLDEEWWPSIQPFSGVDLRSDAARLMQADAAE